jgi:hypothetical protein
MSDKKKVLPPQDGVDALEALSAAGEFYEFLEGVFGTCYTFGAFVAVVAGRIADLRDSADGGPLLAAVAVTFDVMGVMDVLAGAAADSCCDGCKRTM